MKDSLCISHLDTLAAICQPQFGINLMGIGPKVIQITKCLQWNKRLGQEIWAQLSCRRERCLNYGRRRKLGRISPQVCALISINEYCNLKKKIRRAAIIIPSSNCVFFYPVLDVSFFNLMTEFQQISSYYLFPLKTSSRLCRTVQYLLAIEDPANL